MRFWGNECRNGAQHSFSFQPQLSGPWYILRNHVINPEVETKGNYPGPSYAFKYSGPVDRHVLWQNTIVSAGTWSKYGANPLFKAITRNNVIAFTESIREDKDASAQPFTYLSDWQTTNDGESYRPDAAHYESRRSWTHDVDYTGFYWPQGVDFARYDHARYADFRALGDARFTPSFEQHSKRMSVRDFKDVSRHDWALSPSSQAIDAGQWIPGINDDYVGAAPDLGAHEVGGWQPIYGQQPDMSLEQLHAVWSFNG